MKIPPPNYTQSPNIFFDEVFKTLKEGELRVILVIIRQTFGWHKTYDRISLSQIAEKAGMERSRVCKSLNSLIEKGLIQKKKVGSAGQERCYYALVMEASNEESIDDTDGIETEEEKNLISNNFDQCLYDTPPVSLGHPTSVFRTPTKETPTKETKQKVSVVSASPPTSKHEDLPDESKLPAFIDLKTTDNQTLRISQSDLYHRIVSKKMDWSGAAIHYAWKALAEYGGVVHDWWKFIAGTAENYLKKQKSEKITNSKSPKKDSKTCPQYHTQTCNEDSSESDTLELVSVGLMLEQMRAEKRANGLKSQTAFS